MSGIFDEANMRQTLGQYIPNGETLLAGIHAVSKETDITAVFGKCVRLEDGLAPAEDGRTVALHKKKRSPYDIYIGITQYSLLIAECEKNSYLYRFDDDPDVSQADVQEVSSPIPLSAVGTCFSLSDIQSCEIKNGLVGSVKCSIAMKNGSSFKLIFPKLGGLGGNMPHHAQYREAILARLSGKSA